MTIHIGKLSTGAWVGYRWQAGIVIILQGEFASRLSCLHHYQALSHQVIAGV